jgi:hypothetical protein
MSFSPFVNKKYKLRLLGYGPKAQTIETFERYASIHGAGRLGLKSSVWLSLTGKSVASAWSQTAAGVTLFTPLIAYSAAHAQRGEELATFASETLGWYTNGIMATAITGVMSFIPGFAALKPGVRGLLGMLAALGPNAKLQEKMHRHLTFFSGMARQINRLEMGEAADTEVSAASRIRAIQEMSSALTPSRRWLGHEATFMGDTL